MAATDARLLNKACTHAVSRHEHHTITAPHICRCCCLQVVAQQCKAAQAAIRCPAGGGRGCKAAVAGLPAACSPHCSPEEPWAEGQALGEDQRSCGVACEGRCWYAVSKVNQHTLHAASTVSQRIISRVYSSLCAFLQMQAHLCSACAQLRVVNALVPFAATQLSA